MVALSTPPPLKRLPQRFARMPWAALAELVARVGFVAYGVVYLSTGAIAVLAAAGLTPEAEGPTGAMEAWGDWPLGIVLLWLIGLGLYGLAGWRGLQAVFDIEHEGRSLSGLCRRAGQAVSGLAHLGLAISVFGLLDAIEDLRETDDQAQTRAAVARALDLPGGELLVTLAGLVILGVAAGNVFRAIFDHFGRELSCDRDTARLAGCLARVGFAARGLVLVPAGVFMVMAGLHARAWEARSLGGALDALQHQPYGLVALVLLGLGLMAFGVFSVLEGCHRPIRTERAIPA
jgi:hypothetical protein